VVYYHSTILSQVSIINQVDRYPKPCYDNTVAKDKAKTTEPLYKEIILREIDGSHHYWVDGTYCYSVTALLDEAAPVPGELREWFKRQTPESADKIRDDAGEFGTRVHKACETLLLGKEVSLKDEFPDIRGKKSVLSFYNWFNTYRPTGIRTEHKVASIPLRIAGTLDLFCQIGGQNYIIDFKTSSAVRLNHELQISAYKYCYEEMYGVKIDRTFVLRLGSKHRDGYEFKEIIRPFSHFKSVYDTFIALHNGKMPDPPVVDKFPEIIKLSF